MLDLVTPLGRIIPKPGMLPEIEWGGSPRTDGTVRFGSPAILNPDNLQKKIIGVLLFSNGYQKPSKYKENRGLTNRF